MTSISQTSREQAQAAFAKNQAQMMSRARLDVERDELSAARDAKTLRLRELRFEKEASDLALAAATPVARKKRAR